MRMLAVMWVRGSLGVLGAWSVIRVTKTAFERLHQAGRKLFRVGG